MYHHTVLSIQNLIPRHLDQHLRLAYKSCTDSGAPTTGLLVRHTLRALMRRAAPSTSFFFWFLLMMLRPFVALEAVFVCWF